MKSTKLQFPLDAKNLSPHCIDLCQKLLRRNPGTSFMLTRFQQCKIPLIDCFQNLST